MKVSWGTGIAIFFSLFVLFMLFMVYKTTQVDFDLVSEDYYAKEIAYQGVIDKTQNYRKLNQNVLLERKDGGLILKIPAEAINQSSSVKLQLFRPSDGKLDRSLEFAGTSEINIPSTDFVQGKYLLKLEWETDSVGYYFEQEYYH
jgi:hypothetical protein